MELAINLLEHDDPRKERGPSRLKWDVPDGHEIYNFQIR